MIDRPIYGSAANPLRPSKLQWIVTCSVKAYLDMGEPEDEGGPAAQTGSLVHEAVAAFHREPDAARKFEAGMAALRAATPRFPLGDPHDATLSYRPYAHDPRNIDCEMLAVERKVQLILPPHPSDPTGEPIHIAGTLDQIRRIDGRVTVCDVKTGNPSGWQMVHDYALQLSAYTLAARASGFPECEPGAILRTRGYRTREKTGASPDGVFFWLPWDVALCEMLLETIPERVAAIRAGSISFGPGPHCTFCPHGGLAGCTEKIRPLLAL